ncbi:hypothetical protein F3Y22_tig00112523pilonHSYRG00141 [Hibiscus syriacus]|uniref:Uncharacterized protein n=1 Tax=Hibiscus syriacus TaxID=106335 RepID=A0A6A2XFH4_HIBSY|nr:hypothetical protein F3Y22_tig00112523pilonHSYRG00141 [Hibiscus syriacus]
MRNKNAGTITKANVCLGVSWFDINGLGLVLTHSTRLRLDGIEFKSVFLISAQPHIFSNGYQIRFNEAPCSHCALGYMVPE